MRIIDFESFKDFKSFNTAELIHEVEEVVLH